MYIVTIASQEDQEFEVYNLPSKICGTYETYDEALQNAFELSKEIGFSLDIYNSSTFCKTVKNTEIIDINHKDNQGIFMLVMSNEHENYSEAYPVNYLEFYKKDARLIYQSVYHYYVSGSANIDRMDFIKTEKGFFIYEHEKEWWGKLISEYDTTCFGDIWDEFEKYILPSPQLTVSKIYENDENKKFRYVEIYIPYLEKIKDDKFIRNSIYIGIDHFIIDDSYEIVDMLDFNEEIWRENWSYIEKIVENPLYHKFLQEIGEKLINKTVLIK